MGNFALAVLSDGTKASDDMLLPYGECDFVNIPKEYLEMVDCTEELHEDYDSSALMFRFDPQDLILYPEWKTCKGDEWLSVCIPMNMLFDTFEMFLRHMHSDTVTDGYKCGYWSNPNAKWDWYEVGGLYERWCRNHIGGVSMRVGDIMWDEERERALAESEWDERHGKDMMFDACNDRFTREQYVTRESKLNFDAVITPDGKWHEIGEMNQYGPIDCTPEQACRWASEFRERFLADEDLTLTVYDCHF